MLNGSNEAVWAKDVIIEYGVDTKLHLGVQNPQVLPPIAYISQNQYTLITLER
jgi:hypothetical protein